MMNAATTLKEQAKYVGDGLIQWLVQSAAELPASGMHLAIEGVLSSEEMAALSKMKSHKRRSDWLLGRWTAKQLLQKLFGQESGIRPALKDISISSLSNGAPVVNYPLLPVSLSVSHSNGMALCAAVARGGWPLGADIERIEPRQDSFVGDYFTQAEIGLVAGSTIGDRRKMRDGQTTAIWSAKEATLKALQLGLTVDTRAVSCLIQPLTVAPQDWTPFEIVLHERLLQVFPAVNELPQLRGWWRLIDAYALCLVARG